VIKLDPEHKKIALSIKEHLVDQNKFSRDDIVVGASKAKTSSKKKKSEAQEENNEGTES
jgi:small subunit ribosomal protein S1